MPPQQVDEDGQEVLELDAALLVPGHLLLEDGLHVVHDLPRYPHPVGGQPGLRDQSVQPDVAHILNLRHNKYLLAIKYLQVVTHRDAGQRRHALARLVQLVLLCRLDPVVTRVMGQVSGVTCPHPPEPVLEVLHQRSSAAVGGVTAGERRHGPAALHARHRVTSRQAEHRGARGTCHVSRRTRRAHADTQLLYSRPAIALHMF